MGHVAEQVTSQPVGLPPDVAGRFQRSAGIAIPLLVLSVCLALWPRLFANRIASASCSLRNGGQVCNRARSTN